MSRQRVWINFELLGPWMEVRSNEEIGRKFHEIMEKADCGDPIVPMPEWLSLENPYEEDSSASRE